MKHFQYYSQAFGSHYIIYTYICFCSLCCEVPLAFCLFSLYSTFKAGPNEPPKTESASNCESISVELRNYVVFNIGSEMCHFTALTCQHFSYFMRVWHSKTTCGKTLYYSLHLQLCEWCQEETCINISLRLMSVTTLLQGISFHFAFFFSLS